MRKSKYLGFVSGEWKCTHVGVARVQPAFYKGTKERCKRPGHQLYYYIVERMTSDKKAEKLIRLSFQEAADVWKGKTTVTKIADAREERRTRKFTEKISYHFVDRIKR